VAAWVKRTGSLAQSPAVIGWIVEAVDPGQVVYSDADFQAYVRDWYRDLDGVNQTWGSVLSQWQLVVPSTVLALDQAKPTGVGVASLDLARYQQAVYRDLLAVWATELRGRDRNRLLIAGKQSFYRALVSVPTDYDGLAPALSPGVVENDLLAHNIHGVDIARRANTFIALPEFRVTGADPPDQVIGWGREAMLHGACGFGVTEWATVKGSTPLGEALKATLSQIRDQKLGPATPAARAAILYEPFAPGYVVRDEALYGYFRTLRSGEPADLFFGLRLGTRYGQFDYLTEDMLVRAPLDQYGVILAPQAYYLSPESQAALAGYVERGGALVADLGVGQHQAGGKADTLPPLLKSLFGVQAITELKEESANLAAWVSTAAFPSLIAGTATSGADRGRAFGGWVGHVVAEVDVAPLLSRTHRGEPQLAVLARQRGAGLAVYAPTRLWQYWLPGFDLFDEFHGDLVARRSAVQLLGSPRLVGESEVALYADGSVGLLDRTAGLDRVAVASPAGVVYAAPEAIQALRGPAPGCEIAFGGTGLLRATPIPVTIAAEVPIAVQVSKYDATGIELQVTADAPARLRLTVAGGAYPIAAGSRHQLTVEQLDTRQASQLLATADGSAAGTSVSFTLTAKSARLVLSPTAQ
jgi:hypothetical protein